MGWLPGDAYDADRAVDFLRFCTAARADLAAHVPTCPEWDVAALCDHLARVYQGRSHVIATLEFLDRDAFEVRSEGDDPIAWVQRWSDELDRSLLGLDDDAPAVTFMPDATTVHFWRRRMALETLVHRTDAEVATGVATPMDDELSEDGIDELLWFVTHPEQDQADGIETTSVVVLDDAGRTWRVALGDGSVSFPDEDAAPDVTVAGSAGALLLALSGRDLEGIGAARFGIEPLTVQGDPAAFARLLGRLGGF
jgi:uncharacterized protein (TIGR03083 family)